MIIRVDYPAEGCQLRITDVELRRITAFITNSDDQPQVLDLRRRGPVDCEQQVKHAKAQGDYTVTPLERVHRPQNRYEWRTPVPSHAPR